MATNSVELYLYNQIKKLKQPAIYTDVLNIRTYSNILIINNIDLNDNFVEGYYFMLPVYSTTKVYIAKTIKYDANIRSYQIEFNYDIPSIVNFIDSPVSIFSIQDDIYESYRIDLDEYDIEILKQIISYQDIGETKNDISKDIIIKGNKNNQQAFGNIFSLNKISNYNDYEMLGNNYLPIRMVDCKVFKDNICLFIGKFYMKRAVNNNGIISYEGILTSSIQDFKTLIGEKTLEDLDFRDLSHPYMYSNIIQSWSGYTIQYPATGQNPYIMVYNKYLDTYYNVIAEFGKYYTYPYIDYGQVFRSEGFPEENQKVSEFKIQNFKPAIYALEYLNRIFKDIEYTYTIKGNNDLLTKIKHLIIPYSEEGLMVKNKGVMTNFTIIPLRYSPSSQALGGGGSLRFSTDKDIFTINCSLYVSGVNDRGYFVQSGEILYHNQGMAAKATIISKRKFKSSITLDINFSYQNFVVPNNLYKPKVLRLQVVKRGSKEYNDEVRETLNYSDTTGKNSYINNWEILNEIQYDISDPNDLNLYQIIETINIQPTDIEEGDQINVRFAFDTDTRLNIAQYLRYIPEINLYSASLRFSSDTEVYEMEPKQGDIMHINVPKDIKQLDFLKSFAAKYNMLIYPDPSNTKNIIFETYDDYYAKQTPNNIKQFALDLSSKVDWSRDFNIDFNIELAKSYIFTGNDGSDYLNKIYKDSYGKNYGTMSFSDKLGLEDEYEMKLEDIGSVPTVRPGTLRYYIHAPSEFLLADRKPTALGFRFLYMNGAQACSPYKVVDETVQKHLIDNKTAWYLRRQEVFPENIVMNFYGNALNIYLDPISRSTNSPFDMNKPANPIAVEDLNFRVSNVLYLQVPHPSWNIVEGTYKYYRQMITNITREHAKKIECYIQLSLEELNNLELNDPIYISHPVYGSAYFRIEEYVFNPDDDFVKFILHQIIL